MEISENVNTYVCGYIDYAYKHCEKYIFINGENINMKQTYTLLYIFLNNIICSEQINIIALAYNDIRVTKLI